MTPPSHRPIAAPSLRPSLVADAPPPLPAIRLEVVEDTTATSRCDEGYLRVRRRKLVAYYGADAKPSEPFKYDVVERWNADAVGVVPHFVRDGVRHIILRTAVRPPVALRPEPLIVGSRAFPQGAAEGELWEIPAGLVEPEERTVEGLVKCGARETAEEIGISVGIERMAPLGAPFFPSAGIIGECIYLFECEVDPKERAAPAGDGSPLERNARIIEVPLQRALAWCERGMLPDAKTELAIRRLAALLEATGRLS